LGKKPNAILDPRFHAQQGGHALNLFITFEGPEGCGKTTQIRQLANYLREQGHDVLTTREPGGTIIGDRVRAIVLDPAHTEMSPACEFLLFSAARAQHVEQVIIPHLESGGVVLCDRFADSSLAYQGYGHQLDLEVLGLITKFATSGLVPDLTLYLNLPVTVGLKRKAGGDGDSWNRMERMRIAYHERVKAGYLEMAAQAPDRWAVVDASRGLAEVQASIRQLALQRLQEKVKGRRE
jgi:dTMP kinase